MPGGTHPQNDDQAAEALEHEQYPFSQIVANSAIAREAGRTPLFQVSCTFEKAHVKEEVGRASFLLPGKQHSFEFAGTQQEAFHLTHPTCRYDLEFIFEQTSSAVRGMICYASDLFDADSMSCLANNFSELLDSLLSHSETPVSRVPWTQHSKRSADRDPPMRLDQRPASLTDCELTDRNDTPRSASNLETVDRLILRTPPSSRVAMQFEASVITYQELHEQSHRLACGLCKMGVGKGAIVPVVAGKGPDAFLLFLAVHRAGAAILPVDADRLHDLEFQLADTRATLIVADNAQSKQRIQAGTVTVVTPDQLQVADDSVASESLDANEPTDLAYVIYTSGSTGKPKAVMIEHGAVCNTLHWRMSLAPFGPEDRLLNLLSHQFDACLGNAWTTLAQGATLIWSDSAAEMDPDRLMDQIVRDEITVLPVPPSLLRVFVEHPRFPTGDMLRYVWTGGEVVPPSLPAQIRRLCTAPFWNFYGPTEASIEAAACNITEHDSQRPVPIGYPAAGMEITIVDEHRKPVPDTVPGEILISGKGLSRGYLNRPELTAEKFILFGDGEHKRCGYLTGDRGRWNACGQLEFLGRTDDQFKLNGYRIELGEIEASLQSHPEVERAAVKLIPKNNSTMVLVGYVSRKVDRPHELLDAAHDFGVVLRRSLADRLPAYKLPSSIIVLDELPTTSGGKVDKARLPDVPLQSTRPIVPPSTPLEKYLERAWCQVLGTTEISVDQNFFEAGGSSLQAAIVTSRLSQDLGVHVPTALIFDLADITQVASRLSELYPAELSRRFGADLAARVKPTPSSHPLISTFKICPAATKLIMVHPPGGIVACYRELALQLPDDQQLVAIRSRGLHGTEPLPESLEEMAADYVAAMKTIQSAGPYTIGGWSLGGLVAYEMSQQLLTAGEDVCRLILLDTTIPARATDLVDSSSAQVGLEYGIDLTLEELADLPPEDQLPFLWEQAKKLGVLQDNSPTELVQSVLQDLQELFHHHVSLSSNYELQTSSVPISLFRPTDVPVKAWRENSAEPPDRGWSRLSPNVQLHFVSGHHHSMVQSPHVVELGRLIAQQLR